MDDIVRTDFENGLALGMFLGVLILGIFQIIMERSS